jgi:arylsulfatase A-like enzyme
MALFQSPEEAEQERVQLNDRVKQEPRASQEDRDAYSKLYADNLEVADAALGKLFDWLNAEGLLENTIIVLLSDHGEELGERGNVALHSHTLFDELVRVPLMMKAPGCAPRTVDSMVGLIDVVPTVLDLLGMPVLPQMQGRSLAGACRGNGVDGLPVLSEFHYPYFAKVGVRTQTHKFVTTTYGVDLRRGRGPKKRPGGRIARGFKNPARAIKSVLYTLLRKLGLRKSAHEYELYDLQADALERKNVYPTLPAVAESHALLLSEFAQQNARAREAMGKPGAAIAVSHQLKEKMKELGYI